MIFVDPEGKDWYVKDENGAKDYKFVAGQMSDEERMEGGYTYLGFTYLDESTGTYYSLFGQKVENARTEDGKISLESALYEHLDRLIFNYYTSGGQAWENFYFGITPKRYSFSYNGDGFTSKGTFLALDNKDNSILKIFIMPSHEIYRSGFLIGKTGYQLVLMNRTNSGFDPVQIVFEKEDAQRFNYILNSLFKKR